MDKRGQAEAEQTFFMMETLIGIILAGIFIFGALSYSTVTNVEKDYIQKDVALLIETMDESQGKIVYNYELKEAYSLEIEEDSVSVKKSNKVIESLTDKTITFEKEKGDSIKVNYA
jgi:hypothetical protein